MKYGYYIMCGDVEPLSRGPIRKISGQPVDGFASEAEAEEYMDNIFKDKTLLVAGIDSYFILKLYHFIGNEQSV